MFKYLLILLFILLPISSWASSSKITEFQLKEEYGDDLTHAPFFLRFAFERAYNLDWDKSYYAQREAFLEDYEINLAADQAKEKVEAEAEAQEDKDHLNAKKGALQRQRDRLRAEIQQEESEKMDEEARQKEFTETIASQKQELNQMEGQIAQQR